MGESKSQIQISLQHYLIPQFEEHLLLKSSTQTIRMLIIQWVNVIREMGSERVIYGSHTDPGDPIQGDGRQYTIRSRKNPLKEKTWENA